MVVTNVDTIHNNIVEKCFNWYESHYQTILSMDFIRYYADIIYIILW